MEGDADSHGLLGRPQLLREGALDADRCGHGVGRQCEGGHHAVALTLLDRPHPSVGGDGDVEQLVVAGDGRRGRLLVGLPEAGRSLDVAQQEGHRAGRQGSFPLFLFVSSHQITFRFG